ncbi:magnesium transporter [Paenibacillus sp. FSL K6-1230]|uniref:magnesium transporter n=1 Tax=Paenibacillus sp. FSL K6-1230 TaxID=2921603 RepID=UPI0030FC85E7
MSKAISTTTIIELILQGNEFELQALIEKLHPYDVGQLYRDLVLDHQFKLLSQMTAEQVAALIPELEPEEQSEAFGLMDPEQQMLVVAAMEDDDLTYMLDALNTEEKHKLLSTLEAEYSAVIRRRMNYPSETAGRMMTSRYLAVPIHSSVQAIVGQLKAMLPVLESVSYVYVVDKNEGLLGVCSYRDLLLAEPDDLVENFMNTEVITIAADMDQEEAARTIRKYDLLALPVVDEQHRICGIITIDDAVDVVVREADEDIGRLSGSGKEIGLHTPALTASLRRLPWLVLLLFIGLVSGSIIAGFEDTLTQVVALAFFMPMIAGMTGNTGTQSLAVIVRGLASERLNRRKLWKLLLRELQVGVTIGACCGVLIFLIAYLWRGDMMLGLVVGISLFLTLIIGTMSGTVIPLLLNRLKVDPAVASGPLITTINDILSLFIYFSIATALLTLL